MPDTEYLASEHFGRGHNCAQSVFAAFSDRLGLGPDLALRLSSPFGGGMARKGEVCGALSGALMVLGMQYGSERPERKEEMYAIAREFIEQFETQHGTVLCRRLIGQDISTPAGLQAARDANLFHTICPAIVRETARALDEFLLIKHPPG